jgi:hypothetical protein
VDARIEQFRAALMESQQIDTGVHIGGSARGYQELIASLANPTATDHSCARPYIYALPLLAQTPASAAYRAPAPA